MKSSRLDWFLALAWAWPGLLPGAAGWADVRVLLGFAALAAAPLGAWLGQRGLRMAGARPVERFWRALGMAALALASLAAAVGLAAQGGFRAGPASTPWGGLLACCGWLAGGLGLGVLSGARAQVRAPGGESSPWRLCASLWILGLALQALPTRAGLGGEAWARRAPEVAAWAFAIAPWTIALEAAGVDWMRHPAVYSAAGTDWISGARRGPAPGPAASLSAALGVGLLTAACLWTLARSRSPRQECPPVPGLGGPPGPGLG